MLLLNPRHRCCCFIPCNVLIFNLFALNRMNLSFPHLQREYSSTLLKWEIKQSCACVVLSPRFSSTQSFVDYTPLVQTKQLLLIREYYYEYVISNKIHNTTNVPVINSIVLRKSCSHVRARRQQKTLKFSHQRFSTRPHQHNVPIDRPYDFGLHLGENSSFHFSFRAVILILNRPFDLCNGQCILCMVNFI